MELSVTQLVKKVFLLERKRSSITVLVTSLYYTIASARYLQYTFTYAVVFFLHLILDHLSDLFNCPFFKKLNNVLLGACIHEYLTSLRGQ